MVLLSGLTWRLNNWLNHKLSGLGPLVYNVEALVQDGEGEGDGYDSADDRLTDYLTVEMSADSQQGNKLAFRNCNTQHNLLF